METELFRNASRIPQKFNRETACVCVCVCVRERERESEWHGEREIEREKDENDCFMKRFHALSSCARGPDWGLLFCFLQQPHSGRTPSANRCMINWVPINLLMQMSVPIHVESLYLWLSSLLTLCLCLSLPGCLMSEDSVPRGRSGSTALRASPRSSSAWPWAPMTLCWQRMRRWWGDHRLVPDAPPMVILVYFNHGRPGSRLYTPQVFLCSLK